MCGRFSLYIEPEVLEEYYGAHFEEKATYPEYNVAPAAIMPVITNEDTHLFQMIKWGIKPVWYKNKTGLINIRAETLKEKHTFKKMFEGKRCIIPSTGFYEWKVTEAGKKIPYHIKVKDEKVFSFAGLWDDIKDEKTGEVIRGFSIITTETNDLLKDIHNRMPVILPKDKEELWLNTDEPLNTIAGLMTPYDPNQMEAYAISDKINRPTNNNAEILNPA